MAKITLNREELKEVLTAVLNSYHKPGYDVINKLKLALSLEESGAETDPETGDFYLVADLSSFTANNEEVTYDSTYNKILVPLIKYDLLFSKHTIGNVVEVLDFLVSHSTSSVLTIDSTGKFVEHYYDGTFNVYTGSYEEAPDTYPKTCCVAQSADSKTIGYGYQDTTRASVFVTSAGGDRTPEVQEEFVFDFITYLADVAVDKYYLVNGMTVTPYAVGVGLGSRVLALPWVTVYQNSVELAVKTPNSVVKKAIALNIGGLSVEVVTKVESVYNIEFLIYVSRKGGVDVYRVSLDASTSTFSDEVYLGSLQAPEGLQLVYPHHITRYEDDNKIYVIVPDTQTGIVYLYEAGSLEPSYHIGILRDPTALQTSFEFWDPYSVRFLEDDINGDKFFILDRASDSIFSINKADFFKIYEIIVPAQADGVVRINGVKIDSTNNALLDVKVSPDNGATWLDANVLPVAPVESDEFLVKITIKPVINQILLPYSKLEIKQVALKMAI